MCVLCRDTFSRSDILKRHFQKCSIRRGNPTGASHLSHAQAHLKKSHPGPHKAQGSMGNENDIMGVNGMNNNGMGNMGQDPSLHPFGVIPDGSVPDAGSNLTDEQAGQLARSNGMKNMGGGIDRRSMTGAPGGSNRPSFEQQGYAASTMPTGMNPPFNMPNGQNGHSYSQGYDFASHGNGSSMQPQSSVDMSNLQNGRNVYQGATAGQQHGDWSQQLFPSQNQHHQQQQQPQGYMNPYTSNLPNSQVPLKAESLVAVKSENPSLFNGVYPGAPNGLAAPTDFPSWNLQNDPLQEISSRLLFFCFPDNQVIGRSTEIRSYLSSDNIKHFLEQYTNFQGHFPLIHMPTFRIAEAYDGLLLGMICVGAVYSDRMQPTQVRDMMEFVRAVLERNSSIFASISQDHSSEYAKDVAPGKTDLEQLTALLLMHILFVWHGTPVQREKARRQFPLIVALTRKAGLTTPITTASSIAPYSALHQRHVKVENFSAASFDWTAWVEQEKRSRLMYAIYLTDASMVIYFNSAPLFETLEVRLPLPADDATWDARSSMECAEALGLQGPVIARNKNQEGSRRPKQPEMHSALETLMRQDLDLQPGTTNLYSKFILIHALQVQLWSAQKQLSQEAQANPHNLGFPTSGSSTPLSQNDWVVRGIEGAANGAHSATSSGRATPDAASTHQLVKATNIAFDKWKKVWDEDMAVQYPPSSTSYRRFGFCRDGVHFFWLGKYLMKNNRGSEWQMAPDQRFSQIMHLLKYVKGWVHSDSAKRGEELGSVNDIDSDFGVRDLTLDMSQLFKSINKQVDSPVMGVHTGGNSGT